MYQNLFIYECLCLGMQKGKEGFYRNTDLIPGGKEKQTQQESNCNCIFIWCIGKEGSRCHYKA